MPDDSKRRSTAIVSRLTDVIERLRQSLFGADRTDDARLLTEGGRVQTAAVTVSDETVVYRLLDTSGGRIKQASIIAQTDWSASKVSRLLSTMESREQIERVRIGREKVVIDHRGPEE